MESGSALRVEKTTLKPVIKKTYVLDTNVLLHDPTAVTAFNEHHVVIPMTVLEELDHIKDRHDKTVSREARIAINMIDKVVDAATPQEIQEGVEVPGTGIDGPAGTLAIYPDQLLDDSSEVPYLDATHDQANDNPGVFIGDVIGIIESSTSCSSSVITTGDDDSGVFGGGVGVVASGDPDLATVLHAGLPSVGRAFDNVALLLSPIAGASWWFGGEAELARGTSDCWGRWTTMDSSVKKVVQFILCAGVKT